jgi:hypothetical protein
MAQLEYGDYYKFTASAGITLIAGAVVVPWMFLREPFDLAMEASKVALLTPDAQNVIHTRQHLVAAAIHFLPWASGAMAIVGAVLTTYGLFTWHSRQSVRDESEDLQRKKLDRELEAMSPKEIEAKAEDESEISEDAGTGTVSLQAAASGTSALAIEQALLNRIGSCLGPSIQVQTNQRLGNVEFDALIKPHKARRTIVEIKYIRKGFNRGWLRGVITNLSLKMAVFSKTFDEGVAGVAIIVIATSGSPLGRKVRGISEELSREMPSLVENIRVQTIYEADIAAMSCDSLRQLLLG